LTKLITFVVFDSSSYVSFHVINRSFITSRFVIWSRGYQSLAVRRVPSRIPLMPLSLQAQRTQPRHLPGIPQPARSASSIIHFHGGNIDTAADNMCCLGINGTCATDGKCKTRILLGKSGSEVHFATAAPAGGRY
jgi:hypothetical protein